MKLRLRREGARGAAQFDATLAAADFWEEWAAGRKAAVDARSAPVINLVASLEGKRRFDAVRAAQTRLEAGLEREVASALADAADRSHVARVAALIGGVGGVGSVMLLGLVLLGWWALHPVLRLAQAAAAIAAGEPVTIVPSARRDQVGALSRALAQWQSVTIERERFFTLALDANVITNSSGRILDASPATEQITGFTKSELLSRPLAELVHPDDLAAVAASIGDLGNGARVAGFEVRLSLEPVPVAGVVEETVELIRPLAAGRGIVVSTQLSGASGQHVLADLQGLKQVLLNLMSNAVKYNREGGHISVSAELHDGAVRVAVADTGPGIPLRQRGRLFQAFDRLGAENTGVEGTGLGLMLSRQLLIAMGGAISVESSTRGTTFTVELPAAEQQQEHRVGRASTADDPAPNGRRVVLYVEENLSSLQLVERIVERRYHGITILPATQGSRALELAREHHPDLILLDVDLPDIGGHEVLRRLRAEERTAGIPVVVISCGAGQGRIQRALDAGAQACLSKPLDVDRCLAVIDEALVRSPSSVAEW